MPDFPTRQLKTAPMPFISNVEYWLEQTGIAPTFTDSVFGAGGQKGCASPIWVPTRMTVSKLRVLNGTVVAGNIQMALAPNAQQDGSTEHPNMPRPMPSWVTVPAAQAGTSVWQTLDLPTPVDIAPGLWWIMIGVDTPATAKFLALAVTASSNYWDLFNLGGSKSHNDYPIQNITSWYGHASYDVPIIPVMALGTV